MKNTNNKSSFLSIWKRSLEESFFIHYLLMYQNNKSRLRIAINTLEC